MKRAATLSILILFLLNAVGLYGILLGLQFKFASEANLALDEDNYSTSEAITFRIPMTLPYSVEDQDFHRVSGEFENQGEVYRLVKQKLSKDTLYIVCVKDTKSQKINHVLADYVKTFTDRPFNAKQQGTKLNYSIIKDYLNSGISIESDTSGWKECVPFNELAIHSFSFYSSKIKYPPKFSPLS
ncbi:MAG TPA: hypothetical protein VGQ59_09400 [Cyclobacteriaceae bacterium]|jgi:hypothetical protein|nr:hypothetical protein [Cyclobacteriaceae bacterium]